jgi:hypothetical protein
VRIGKRQAPSVPGAIGQGQELAAHPPPKPDQEHDEEGGGVDGAVIRPPPPARGGELASDRILRGVAQLVRDPPGLLLAAGFVPDPLRCRETQERHSAQVRERPLESKSDSQRVAGEHRLEERRSSPRDSALASGSAASGGAARLFVSRRSWYSAAPASIGRCTRGW